MTVREKNPGDAAFVAFIHGKVEESEYDNPPLTTTIESANDRDGTIKMVIGKIAGLQTILHPIEQDEIKDEQ